MSKKYTLMLFGALTVLVADQLTKIAAINHLKNRKSVEIIDNLFAFTFVGNDGAAFGLFSGYTIYFFLAVSTLAIGIILYLFHQMEESEIVVPVALSLVLGGAVGNLIDRIRLGEVIDFIYIHYKRFAWPAFNIADIAITAGVILLILRMFFLENRSEPEKK